MLSTPTSTSRYDIMKAGYVVAPIDNLLNNDYETASMYHSRITREPLAATRCKCRAGSARCMSARA
jgi:hypothetical protein